jgi:hypothetical protein
MKKENSVQTVYSLFSPGIFYAVRTGKTAMLLHKTTRRYLNR